MPLSRPVSTRLLACAAVLATAGLAACSDSAAETQPPPADRAEIEAIVRDYILANPEIVQQALVELDRRQQDAAAAERNAQVAANAELLFHSAHQVVLGNPDGPITLVEFFDYNCVYCEGALPDLLALMDANPDLRVVLKEFPILGAGSVEAAQVAIAFNELAPERYLDFHRALLLTEGQVGRERAIAVAAGLGVATADIEAHLADPIVEDTISEVYGLATALGLTGTPTYVVGGEVVMGAVGREALAARIEAVREGETAAL